jgi:hypothetical protein
MPTQPFARAFLALSVAVLLAACGGDDGGGEEATDTPPPAPAVSVTQPADGNWFVNAGFEEGAEPWITLHPQEGVGFTVSQDFAHSGSNSALLRMRDPADAEGAKVYYLVQEVSPGDFPDTIRGYYRVENWVKNTPRQYIQFVVIAFGPDNFPAAVGNYQLRYLLAGTDSAPFVINNAYFVFLGRDDPTQGEWVPFEANIRDDFQRLWGKVPEGFDKLRLLFEVRWDGKTAGDGVAEADVYYDDLYIGTARP